eukprot:SAG31_NODE_1571_length_7851_cov_8.714525_7_plen_143_part_00
MFCHGWPQEICNQNQASPEAVRLLQGGEEASRLLRMELEKLSMSALRSRAIKELGDGRYKRLAQSAGRDPVLFVASPFFSKNATKLTIAYNRIPAALSDSKRSLQWYTRTTGWRNCFTDTNCPGRIGLAYSALSSRIFTTYR